jgi:hypothetical protein
MKPFWSKLGGQLGLGCIAVGILAIGLGWNGAASIDFAQGQLPYLLSGGFLGLALVALGATLVIVQNNRRDRSLLELQLQELNGAIGRLSNTLSSNGPGSTVDRRGAAAHVSDPTVVVGRSSFHRPECRLVAGKDLRATSIDAAVAEGLNPCRICKPVERSGSPVRV